MPIRFKAVVVNGMLMLGAVVAAILVATLNLKDLPSITMKELAALAKPVALDPDLAVALTNLQAASLFNQPGDWVFASPASGGKKPYWPDMALNRHVRPAATKLEITKRIGWHTFRHTYATLLKSSGADVKVVQDSLRHANARITMEMYTISRVDSPGAPWL